MSTKERMRQSWRKAEKEGRTHLGPKPAGPMPKSFLHFATVEEWEQHRREVKEAQEQGAPF